MGLRILVTGGAGFIGSNFINYWHRQYPGDWIVNLDKLTYAGNLDNLIDVQLEARHHFVKGDICDKSIVGKIMTAGVDWIINFAAEGYVDGSITAPADFIKTNVLGVQNLLEYAKAYGVKKFLQVSTADVYGNPEPEECVIETTPPAPRNPDSASKAAADLMVMAYYHTYGLPVVITRSTANYGPHQNQQNLIPLLISQAAAEQKILLANAGISSHDWLHVRDHCRAIDLVLHQGRVGEIYNISGQNQRTELELVEMILEQLGKSYKLISRGQEPSVKPRRPVISSRKIESELGWGVTVPFEAGLTETIRWYQTHQEWWHNRG